MFRSGFRKSARKGFRSAGVAGHSGPIAPDEQITTFNGNPLSFYSLLDVFSDNRTPGFISGTLPVVGGARVVTDTNSKLSIAGGVANFATGGVGAGDPGLWYPSQARAFGRVVIGRVIPASTGIELQLGWDSAQAGGISDAFRMAADATLRIIFNVSQITLGVYTATTYDIAVVERATGMYYFIKGGAFTNWTLIWSSAVGNGATMYPAVVAGGTAAVFTADNIRVPVALYTVPQLCYDTFTTSLTAVDSSGQGNNGTHVAVGLDGN